MKKTIAFLLALLMLALLPLSLTGCGEKTADTSDASGAASASTAAGSSSAPADSSNAATTEEAYKGRTLTVAVSAEPNALIAQVATPDIGTGHISRLIYGYLYDFDENGEIVPSLATGYEWVDDTTLRLTLRQGVYFDNGDEFTADDVIYSWNLGLEGSNMNSFDTPYISEEFVAEDDYTVLMKFEYPYPAAIQQLADMGYPMLCESMIDELGGSQDAAMNPQLGGGRYNFVEWVPGQHILLQYNPDYWDTSFVPEYEYMEFKFIPDTASRCLAVQSGEADIALSISLADTFAYQDDPNLSVESFAAEGVGGATFFYRCDEGSPFADAKVREALNYLIDWKACAKILTGSEDNSMQSSINYGSPYYPGPDERYYDLDKGMALLAESAYPDGFEFELKIEPTDGFETVAQKMQADLLKAGITANLYNVDFAAWFTMFSEDDYEAYISTTISTPLFVNLGYFDGREMAFGGPRLANENLYPLIDTAKQTFDEQERYNAVMELQQYVMDNNLCMGIASSQRYMLTNKTVTNFVLDGLGYTILYHMKYAG